MVYDGFHIVQWFNLKVVDSLRRSEAKRLKSQADALRRAEDEEGAREVERERSLLFGARWNLLANERTLRAKDALAAELNAEARAAALAEGRDPAGAGLRRQDNEEARQALLDANASLHCAVRAREELQGALALDDPALMRSTLEAWCELYSLTGIRQLTSFAGIVMRKMEGIVARASHRISSGVLKGTNTLIKNMRRRAFGIARWSQRAVFACQVFGDRGL